jgi:mRNA interferase MazF
LTKNIQSATNAEEKRVKTMKIQSWVQSKEKLSHDFIENKGYYRKKPIFQGDIYQCDIGENIGEETCNSRPVLIVSKSFYNHNSSQVTVIPLTETVQTKIVVQQGKKKTKMKTRTHYLLRKMEFDFLNADSAVKCEQIKSVSKSRLIHKLGSIDQVTLKRIQNRITDLLDL